MQHEVNWKEAYRARLSAGITPDTQFTWISISLEPNYCQGIVYSVSGYFFVTFQDRIDEITSFGKVTKYPGCCCVTPVYLDGKMYFQEAKKNTSVMFPGGVEVSGLPPHPPLGIEIKTFGTTRRYFSIPGEGIIEYQKSTYCLTRKFSDRPYIFKHKDTKTFVNSPNGCFASKYQFANTQEGVECTFLVTKENFSLERLKGFSVCEAMVADGKIFLLVLNSKKEVGIVSPKI